MEKNIRFLRNALPIVLVWAFAMCGEGCKNDASEITILSFDVNVQCIPEENEGILSATLSKNVDSVCFELYAKEGLLEKNASKINSKCGKYVYTLNEASIKCLDSIWEVKHLITREEKDNIKSAVKKAGINGSFML